MLLKRLIAQKTFYAGGMVLLLCCTFPEDGYSQVGELGVGVPAWIDRGKYDRVFRETPNEGSLAPGLGSTKPSGENPEIIEKGADYRIVKSRVAAGIVRQGRQERFEALEVEVNHFLVEHPNIRESITFPRDAEELTELQKEWLALEGEWQQLKEVLAGPLDAEGLFHEQEYVEMATGLHYWSEADQAWRNSRPVIELIEGIGVARQGQQKVLFAPVLTEKGAIHIETPDGKLLKATVLGLAYVDAESGNDVVIATVRPSRGTLVGENQVIYEDAFDSIDADVIYTYRRSGLEQDVVIRSKIPQPEHFGLPSETSRLEVLTEFFDPPEPEERRQRLFARPNTAGRAMGQPDVVDVGLSFGAVEIAMGRAFWSGDRSGRRKDAANVSANQDRPIGVNGLPAGLEYDQPSLMLPMAKEWLEQGGRTILCEGVEFRSIAPLLDALPESRRGRADLRKNYLDGRKTRIANLSSSRQIPVIPVGEWPELGGGEVQLAQVDSLPSIEEDGLVLDWQTLNPTANHTFEAGRTYWVSSDVALTGTTTIEGGGVIKFSRSVSGATVQLRCLGPVVCKTGPYQPTVLTAIDDNCFGSFIPGSTGTPTGHYPMNALWIEPGGAAVTIEYLRVLHAQNGIFFENSQGGKLRHSQLLNCIHPVATRHQDLDVENVLIDGFETYAFWASHSWPPLPINPGEEVRIHATNVTVHDGPWTAWNSHWNGSMGQTDITNSLIVNVNGGVASGQFVEGDVGLAFTQSHFLDNVDSSTIFASQGQANFYLPSPSPYRNAGTSSIDISLRADLENRTTTAPVVHSGAISGTVLPIIPRDNDGALDLGYHYDLIDHATSFATLSGSVTVSPGTVVACTGSVGMYTYGQYWGWGIQNFVSLNGTPWNPILCVDAETVQEQPVYQSSSNSMMPIGTDNRTEVTVDHTDIYGIGRHRLVATSWANLGTLKIRHSRFLNAGLYFTVDPGFSLILRNSLIDGREPWYFYGDGALEVHNCMFRISHVHLNRSSYSSWAWKVYNNVFDYGDVSAPSSNVSGSFQSSHNASIHDPSVSPGGFEGQDYVISGPFPWQSGPLGHYYQPTSNNPLLNGGYSFSTSAYDPADRLTHYTVRSDLVPEGHSTLDVGLHYLATDSDGIPLDTNGDGIGNYIQDLNANNYSDYGVEDNWTASPLDFDGDGLLDAREQFLGTISYNVDTDGDGIWDFMEVNVGSDVFSDEDWSLNQPFNYRIHTMAPSISSRLP